MLKFFVALGVVMVVSLVSLGWRVGIVVAAAVPLTLAVVFVIMLERDAPSTGSRWEHSSSPRTAGR